jgi:hypothetical protein
LTFTAAENGFLSPVFTEEFTSIKKHQDPKLINYGYYLSLKQDFKAGEVPYDHAVCVVRLYPFSTFGDQSLLVLDSGIKKILKFNNHLEMIQHLSVDYAGLSSFLSISGYSRKQYEETDRRLALIQKLQFISGEISRPIFNASGEVASGGGAGAASGGGAGGGGGAGYGSEDELEAGKTYYSFDLQNGKTYFSL